MLRRNLLASIMLFVFVAGLAALDNDKHSQPQQPTGSHGASQAKTSDRSGGSRWEGASANAELAAVQKLLRKWITRISPTSAARAANIASATLLLLCAPQALQAGVLGGGALRNVLLSSWASAFGALLMLRELRLRPVQRWMRRNFRFLTTQSGSLAVSLCASSMALASGPRGILPGVATLGSAWFAAAVRRRAKLRSRKNPVSPRIAPPNASSVTCSRTGQRTAFDVERNTTTAAL
mmetsp:Transcript_28296/g.59474  ORF Transcript_28296/g.59474 Transcript_28296/m.59474 type:complete len:237 (+) Transcript_28296:264-974(+)|eukprot:1075061-Pleurochrysis_carterae.AAC.8